MNIRKLISPVFSGGAFAVAFVYFYRLQFSTANIPGFDGHYHIKLAWLIKEQGLLKTFPWLQYTYLKDHFVDIHFLYHILLIPFTFGDLTYGAKLSTVVFFAAMAAVFYLVLSKYRAPAPWFWFVILLIGSPPFLYRMSLPRAPVTALPLLLLGSWFLVKNKRRALFFFSFLFVWMYGAFTILLVYAGFWFSSKRLIDKSFDHKTLLALVAGILAGFVINPYFPENSIFLYTQTFEAGISRVIPGGGEWRPYDWDELLAHHDFLVILTGSALTGFAFAKRKPRPETLTWVVFSVFMFYMTMKSKRFIEYLPPCMIMACALLTRDAWREWRKTPQFKPKWISFAWTFLSILSLLWVFPRQQQMAESELYDRRDPGRYKKAALWLKENTPAGSIVYTSDWDDFPELFFYNSQNHYIVGLDPAFLHIYDKALYKIWDNINLGNIKGDPYPVFLNLFKTPYLFTDTEHGPFINLLRKNRRIKLAYEDDNARVYALK